MPPPLTIEDYYRVPGGAAPVRRLHDQLIRTDTEERVGVVYDSERRLQWDVTGPAELRDRIGSEQAAWDNWANDERAKLRTMEPLPLESRTQDWWDDPLYADPGVARSIAE